MKKLFLIAILFLIGVSSEAQVTDTAAYLQSEVVAKKSLFVGRHFSVLIDSLKVTPISFVGESPHSNKNIEVNTTFYIKISRKSKDRIALIIEWEDPIDKTATFTQTQKDNNYLFTNPIKLLYSDKIIKDILLYPIPQFITR